MVDRISLLPDGVISHILSFLPTKEAVATSALSKRWYPLWRSVSALNLTDEFVPDDIAYSLYKEFVLSVLLFRHPAQPIKRFSLVCSYDDDCIDCNLNKWVSVVLQRGVEYLRLLMTNEIHYHKLPVGIFSCKTLRVLKLNSFRVNVNDVSSVELPLLKVLQLKKIQFTQYRFIPELLSGCPNLEEIHATYLRCAWHGREGNFKSLTKLARATIRGRDLKIPLATLNNVEYLNLFLRVSPYFDHMPTFHNLTHAKLYFREYRWQLLVEVLNHCPKLQILFIQQEVASNADENWVSPRFVPECVLSHLKECTIREYGGMRGDLRFARYMLQNAGVLHTMTIHSTSSSNSDTKLQILQELSSCPRSSTACKLFFT